MDKVADELGDTSIVVIGHSDRYPTFADWRDAYPADDPDEPQGPGRRRLPALLVGHDRPSQGRAADAAQPLQRSRALPRDDGPGRGLGQPGRHAAVPHRWWRVDRSPASRSGATNVLVRDIDPADLVELIERERITHGFLVPAVLQFMLAVPGVNERDFSALRALLYGASPISEQVLSDSIRTFGCEFLQAYGLTETTGTVVLLPAGRPRPRRTQSPSPAGRRLGRPRDRSSHRRCADRRGRGPGRGRRDLDP